MNKSNDGPVVTYRAGQNFPEMPGDRHILGLGNSNNSFLILRTQDIGVPLEATILMYALVNLAAALISFPAGFFSDKVRRKNVLVASFIIFALTYVGFACTEFLNFCCTVYLVRSVSGDISGIR